MTLADGGIDLLGRLAVLAALFVQRGLAALGKKKRRRGSPWLHRWQRRGLRRGKVPSPPAPSASCRHPVRGGCSCPAGMSCRRSVGVPLIHLSKWKPCIISQAMPCFSCITSMVCAVSKVDSYMIGILLKTCACNFSLQQQIRPTHVGSHTSKGRRYCL